MVMGEVKVETAALPGRPRRRRRFLMVGLVLVAALGGLMYMGVRGAAMYYLTVDELLERGEAAYSQQVRLHGKVMSGSIEHERATATHRFIVGGDGPGSLPVVYRGAVPDTFQEESEVVLEGSLTPMGVFEAKTLLAKCPSKYEPAVEKKP